MSNYASSNAEIVARTPGWQGLARNHLASFARVALACPLLLSWAASKSLGAESTAPPPVGSEVQPTNAHEAIAAFLQLQEQLEATQIALKRNFQETKSAVAQNAEAGSNGLQSVRETFVFQQAQDLQAMQKTDSVMLMVAGVLAAVGVRKPRLLIR